MNLLDSSGNTVFPATLYEISLNELPSLPSPFPSGVGIIGDHTGSDFYCPNHLRQVFSTTLFSTHPRLDPVTSCLLFLLHRVPFGILRFNTPTSFYVITAVLQLFSPSLKNLLLLWPEADFSPEALFILRIACRMSVRAPRVGIKTLPSARLPS